MSYNPKELTELGELLKSYCKSNDLTWSELGDLVGLNRQGVYRVTRGDSLLSHRVACEFGTLLGMDPTSVMLLGLKADVLKEIRDNWNALTRLIRATINVGFSAPVLSVILSILSNELRARRTSLGALNAEVIDGYLGTLDSN